MSSSQSQCMMINRMGISNKTNLSKIGDFMEKHPQYWRSKARDLFLLI